MYYFFIFSEKLLQKVSLKFINTKIFHFGGETEMGTEMNLAAKFECYTVKGGFLTCHFNAEIGTEVKMITMMKFRQADFQYSSKIWRSRYEIVQLSHSGNI